MRLSEAIRLGSMLRPQAHGTLYTMRDAPVAGDVLGLRQAKTASCALGAAFEAAGATTRHEITDTARVSVRGVAPAGMIVQVFDVPGEWLALPSVECPVCKGYANAIAITVHLNDDHQWTREAIADWVETLEQPAPVDVTAAELVTA